jgi:hypothetical protein
MHIRIFLSILLIAISHYAMAYSVTFQVDMNNVSGFATPELNGTFNDWCGNCTAMTDVDGDNVWEVTVQLTTGFYEYKFSYDNWQGAEVLLPGTACTLTTGGFTNRYVQVNGTLIIPVVCWQECTACVEPTPVQVVFNLDATALMPTNAGISASFNNYCSYCEPMADLGNGIFSDTLMLIPGVYEFYYTLNSGATAEQMQDDVCMLMANNNYHRVVVVSEATTLPQVCWQSCQNCATNVLSNTTAEWTLFPNPAQDYITVDMPNAEATSIIIYDTYGREVLNNTSAMRNSQILDVRALEVGVYYLHMSSQKNNFITKFIIEK